MWLTNLTYLLCYFICFIHLLPSIWGLVRSNFKTQIYTKAWCHMPAISTFPAGQEDCEFQTNQGCIMWPPFPSKKSEHHLHCSPVWSLIPDMLNTTTYLGSVWKCEKILKLERWPVTWWLESFGVLLAQLSWWKVVASLYGHMVSPQHCGQGQSINT